VRLIRALVEHGEVPIAGVRSILDAIGSPPEAVHELLGVAHCALPTPPTSGTLSPDVADLVADLGWHVDPGSPALHWFSDTVGAARAVGVPLDRSALRRYSEAMRQVAAVDVDTATAGGSVAAATRMVAVGTTMLDPMLTALRRVAQEAESADRFGWGDDDGPVGVDRAVIET
jgi:hypothetical protein